MSSYKGQASEAGRAQALLAARERSREDMESQKRQMEADTTRTTAKIGSKFASTPTNTLEADLKASTYGLVTLKQMKERQSLLEEAKEENIKKKLAEKNEDGDRKRKKKKKKQPKAVLSFDEDAEVDIPEEKASKKLKSTKNPDVDTSFLPDRDRDRKDRLERQDLMREWTETQDKLKAEPVTITYSYWDGSGHRRSITLKKGDTIDVFLKGVLADMRSEFHELRGVTSEGLVYVKEDLLIPGSYSFYDFIVTKARGKSGPLFNFDVHDDVRLVNDASVEKDESHAGKVILRSWYERNKHIFPASRWEMYDPEKKWDKYTIADFNEDEA
eukprot:m.199894 g.199894  ORF g.199894 m.199894 type:complete len:329 (-) comp25182_c2_seq1:1258-2244(-)